jgi:hypothetical protein
MPEPYLPLSDPAGLFDAARCGGGGSPTVYTDYADPLPANGLYFVSIYQANNDHSFFYPVAADFLLTIDRTDPISLVLATNEPVNWIIDAATGAQIEQIFLVRGGSAASSVTGVEASVQEIDAIYDIDGPGVQPYIADVETATGLTAAAFAGCYQMTEIRIGY